MCRSAFESPRQWRVAFEVFNIADVRWNDIEYYYVSRLRNEAGRRRRTMWFIPVCRGPSGRTFNYGFERRRQRPERPAIETSPGYLVDLRYAHDVDAQPIVHWTEGGEACSARWRSESGAPPPRRVVIADDRTTADDAYGLACQGTALLWRGDFQNARQMLVALATRAERRARKPKKLGRILDAAYRRRSVPSATARPGHNGRARWARCWCRSRRTMVFRLRRAPDIRQACAEAYGPGEGPSIASLRALLGLIGAHEWRTQGN